MYFPHAFQKMFLATAGFEKAAGVFGSALAPAEVGVMNYNTNESVDLTASAPAFSDLPMITISQGSLHTKDKLGPLDGGYKHSLKSKGINPRYVSRFYKYTGHGPTNQISTFGLCSDTSVLQCGTTYYMRLTLKGQPALHYMNREIYHIFDGYTGCCPALPGSQTVKEHTVVEQWAQQIMSNRDFTPFVQTALVYTWTTSGAVNGTATVNVTADMTLAQIVAARPANVFAAGNTKDNVKLQLTGAYTDTTFSNASFDKNDFHGAEPLTFEMTGLDETHNPCLNPSFCFTTTQLAVMATGTGEKILRDKMLSDSYNLEQFHDSNRMREVLDENLMSYVNRAKNDYVFYYILHTVPRKSNPSSIGDNDQYLLCVVANAADADFETWFQDWLTTANSEVKMEVITP